MSFRSRDGFTLIEVLVAIVILAVGALALVGSSRVATTSLRRATLELRAAQLIQEEVDRLRTVPLAGLASGMAMLPDGESRWLVTDSGSYLRVEVEVRTRPEAGAELWDTVYVYRPR